MELNHYRTRAPEKGTLESLGGIFNLNPTSDNIISIKNVIIYFKSFTCPILLNSYNQILNVSHSAVACQ